MPVGFEMRFKILGYIYFSYRRTHRRYADAVCGQPAHQHFGFFFRVIRHTLSVPAPKLNPANTQLLKQCDLLIHRHINLIRKAADRTFR